eukprot:38835-Prymnesium_polylepis.4
MRRHNCLPIAVSSQNDDDDALVMLAGEEAGGDEAGTEVDEGEIPEVKKSSSWGAALLTCKQQFFKQLDQLAGDMSSENGVAWYDATTSKPQGHQTKCKMPNPMRCVPHAASILLWPLAA